MKFELVAKLLVFIALSTVWTQTGYAQLNRTFERMFNQILDEDRFSEFERGDPFAGAAQRANQTFTPVMNGLIASNVASFPLTSTTAGVSFDLSSGVPELITESLGPVFAETAETVGKGKINAGFNYSFYNLAGLRGLAAGDIRFTITSEDLNGGGILGDFFPEEAETIDIFPNLDVNAYTLVFWATRGLTSNFDIGIAVPIVHLSLSGRARAVINSVSFFSDIGAALNNFNNDPFNPQLVDFYNYNESFTGVGDVSLRLKYAFLTEHFVNSAALIDLRVPTGEEEEFLGTGKVNAKFAWILSTKTSGFATHLNLTYERRWASFDSNEFELMAGFDQKLSDAVTFVADFLGEFDLDDSGLELPGQQLILAVSTQSDTASIAVDLTNIPDQGKDHVFNASLGLRIAPSYRLSILANILLPMNTDGLRSTVIPTFGFAMTF